MRWLVVVLPLAACAAASRPVPSSNDLEELPALVAALDDAERNLSGPQALATQADCGHACELERRICELAERICTIADRHPDDPGARERCDDGRTRCARAHAKVSAQCTCLDRSGPVLRP